MSICEEELTTRMLTAFERGGLDALYDEMLDDSLESDDDDDGASLASVLDGVARETARLTPVIKSDVDDASHVADSHSNDLTIETHALKLREQTEGVLESFIKTTNKTAAPRRSAEVRGSTGLGVMNKCRRKIAHPQGVRSKTLSIPGLGVDVCKELAAYVHQCQVRRCYPLVDRIHNILLMDAAKKKRYKAQCKHLKPLQTSSVTCGENSRTRFIYGSTARALMAQLVVQLWKCSQDTPYMKANRRPTDVFRPFAAGVLFAMRRGITLDSGVCIAPRCEFISHHLSLAPAVRRGTEAHRTHLLAHRGVNTLQRCMTSLCGDDNVESVYKSAIAVSAELKACLAI